MFFSRVLPALFAASSLVQALSVSTHVDDYFFTSFLNRLHEHGANIVANNYERVANTKDGQTIIDTLKYGGELTILAPSDEAFHNENTTLDTDLIKYNILLGNVDKNFISSESYHHRRGASKSHSTARSTFRRKKSKKVQTKRNNDQGWGKGLDLDIDKLQVQVVDQFVDDENWKRWNVNRVIIIDRPVGSAGVTDRFSFKKIIILIIDAVLSLPPTVLELLRKPLIKDAPNGFKKALEALEEAGLTEVVNNRDEITAFVPVDSSFSDGDHESEHGLSEIVKNHIVFGKIVYTTLFGKIHEATAESGKELRFFFENDIHYVCCGETKAIILRGDVIAETGVVHVIDRPLIC